MVPPKSSIDRAVNTRRHQPQRLRTSLTHLTVGMRELEEQLPLPADRRIRDTTPAQQKAAALRVDLDELDARLLKLWYWIRGY